MASVLSIGLVSACSAAVSGAGGDTSVLRLAAAVENDTFDPAQLTGGQKDQYWQAVYDTVLKLNYETQQPEPNVGTDWKYSENKTVLTVTLRDDVKFSDGSPLTGEADSNPPPRISAAPHRRTERRTHDRRYRHHRHLAQGELTKHGEHAPDKRDQRHERVFSFTVRCCRR
jgi:hypothetical protein